MDVGEGTYGSPVSNATDVAPAAASPFGTGGYASRPEIRWVWCLAGLLVAVGALVASVRVFVFTPATRLVDQAAFLGSTYGRDELEPYSKFVLGVVSVPFLVGATLLAVVIAVARKAFGDAVRAVVVVVGANLTTQLLKAAIERPIDDLPEATYGNSLPSGHTTVAASVAAVLLLVVGRGWRPPVALLGLLYAAATGVATLTLGWHRPSDVVAAFAVVTAWALLVLIPNRGRRVKDVTSSPLRILVAWLLAIGAIAGLATAAVTIAAALGVAAGDLSSSSAVLEPTSLRAAYLGSCAGTAGAAAALTWLQLLARR